MKVRILTIGLSTTEEEANMESTPFEVLIRLKQQLEIRL